MIDALCVIAHPSRLGRADTELDHQIHCWRAMGLTVHICPSNRPDSNQLALGLEERGCIYHTPRDWPSLEGLHCISFCNGEFLEALPDIRRHARTANFVNCMTWNFDRELEMQERGLIDFHLYQIDHAIDHVGRKLRPLGKYRPQRFQPYFHAAEFPFHAERPTDAFRFGRISRDSADKYGGRQLWIYETMTAPVIKEGIILGWGANAELRYGRRPDSYIRAIARRIREVFLRYYT